MTTTTTTTTSTEASELSGDRLSVAYLDWCRSEGIPDTTIRRRACTLRSVGNAGTASREDLEAWWTSRADKRAATRAADLATLRTFYRWARVWEHRDDDPSLRIRRPKVPNGLPHPISEDDLAHLLATYRTTRPDIYRAVVLGARLGLRVAEAADLTWSNIDRPHRAVTVRGKGSKARRIVITADQLEQLGDPGDPATSVVTGTSELLEPKVLDARINRAMRAAGVQETFHNLRHRAGTVAYQATQDLVAVRDFLGHASITTTTVYAAAAQAAAQQIASAL